MRTQSTTEKDFATEIVCTAPWRLMNVKALDNYRLEVNFVDGTHGFVEMPNRIMGNNAGVFATLKDKHIFNQVHLEYGVATWPGEIDLAPDTMHDEIKSNGTWILN